MSWKIRPYGLFSRAISSSSFARSRANSTRSVDDTIKTWCEFNNCEMEPKLLKEASREEDGTSVERFERRGSSHDAVVVLVKINGGGHTWPGGPNALAFLGKTTKNISANDTMWRFFLEHPLAATK